MIFICKSDPGCYTLDPSDKQNPISICTIYYTLLSCVARDLAIPICGFLGSQYRQLEVCHVLAIPAGS